MVWPEGVMRQTVLPTSSATRSAPFLAMATPAGSSARIAVRSQEAAQDIHGRTTRSAFREGNEHDLIAAGRLAIPRTVLPNKRAALELLRKQHAARECETE